MKKTISSIVASVMAVSAMTAVSASAINLEEENVLSISTETVASTMTIDGTEIPAGAVAITVNIDNNNGFVSTMTKLNVGTGNVILNSNGKPVLETGVAFGESLIAADEKEGVIAVSTASAEANIINGEIFTFFVTDYNSVNILNSEVFSYSSISDYTISPMSSVNNYYITGDVDDDDLINSFDASLVLSALNKVGLTQLEYEDVAMFPGFYFPDIYVVDAAFIWQDKRNITKENTADIMLDYYVCTQTGSGYNRPTGCKIGTPVPVSSQI